VAAGDRQRRSLTLKNEWEQVYSDVEDILAPSLGLDPWERVLYYHLLRHTRLKGQNSGMFAVAPLSKAVGISDFKVRDVLRSLHRKGCARIEDRSRNGHLVAVLLPSEIPGLQRPSEEFTPLDIESLDFFTERRYLAALLARENNMCFYCMKQLAEATCELDHLIPQAEKLDNSYRNIVAACHACNKSKGELAAPDFVRKLYREGVLNEKEFQQRLAAIVAVQASELVPNVERR
jgi:HNH endonuclease